MSINFISSNHKNRMREIVTYCFSIVQSAQESHRKFFEDFVKEEYSLGYFDEYGTLMAQVLCLPYEVYIDGTPMKMGGIAYVSSMPEGRHGGKIGSLLTEWQRVMRETGQYVSMLGPFSYEFYRKYGYEIGFDVLKYTIPIEHLRSFKGKYKMKGYDKKDFSALKAVYEVYAKKHNGSMRRDDRLWTEFTFKHFWDGPNTRYTYVCYDENTLKGYIIFSINSFNERKMNVLEIVYNDRETLDTLLSFIYSHQAQVGEVSISAPMDDMIQYMLPNPRVKREVGAGMMFRVVDVKAALLQKNAEGMENCSFSIKIKDSIAPWNETPYKVSVRDGKIHVSECSNAEIECDIQAFSQLFVGYLTPSEVFRSGRLEGKSDVVKEMDKMFKKSYTLNTNPF